MHDLQRTAYKSYGQELTRTEEDIFRYSSIEWEEIFFPELYRGVESLLHVAADQVYIWVRNNRSICQSLAYYYQAGKIIDSTLECTNSLHYSRCCTYLVEKSTALTGATYHFPGVIP